MKFTVIIPSRYQSTRLPGKPLVQLAGKSMIQRVWQQAQQSGAERVIIATDDERIQSHCKLFGAEVCMTSSAHESGTDRLAEVVKKCKLATDEMIVNVQGDEPLIPPENIKQVAMLLMLPNQAPMATLATCIENEHELFDANTVKVVMSQKNTALYFSRATIPYDRDLKGAAIIDSSAPYYRHIGIYAYRAGFLHTFSQWPIAALEQVEKLEQLRVLANGECINIAVAEVSPVAGIDTPGDVDRIEALLTKG